MSKIQFKSRKDASKFLAEKGIDTTNWTEIKWLSLNKGQAEIHMMALAEAMWDALNESKPKELQPGEWHIPFEDKIQYSVQDGEYTTYLPETLVKIATAMCARVSYTVVGEEGKVPNYQNDIKLHDRLLLSGHASPMEHIAQCQDNSNRFANFKGFKQYRTILEEQSIL